ncbi:MAG TPA: DUF2750 domain-containing protein [Chthoniobacterales bacterium]
MSDDSASAEENYEAFIARVRETGKVWGLCRDSEEWAYSESNEYEDAEVLLFWSDRERALAHQQDEWKQHRPTAIELEDFLERWLPGMDDDGALVGPDWDANFEGLEVTPEELAERLIDEGEEGDEES